MKLLSKLFIFVLPILFSATIVYASTTPTPIQPPIPTFVKTPTPTLTIKTNAVINTATTQSITDLQVVNTDTQKVEIDPLVNGTKIDLSNGTNFNINAVTNPSTVGSVVFNLNGHIHTENVAPYDDPGDTGGKFNPFTPPLVVGNYTLTVTPWTTSGGTGTAGTATTVTFSVINSGGTGTPTPTGSLTPTPTGTITPTPTPNGATDDWATYKFNAQRSAYNSSETIINASTASSLKQKLDITPPSSNAIISDAPAVVNNVMYYGDWTGNFYAKNVKDGSTIWVRNLGVMTPPAANNCNPPSLGTVSSPSVRTITVNGINTPIVFIAGADGNMYALKASDGSILWKTFLATQSKGELLWDSPLEANGSVYVGVASLGDCPLVQGKIYKLDWRFGTIQATAKLVPDGCVGAGSWGSPTFDQANNKLYVSTGTQDNSCHFNGSLHYVEPYALALVELDGSSLNILGTFRIPTSEQGPDSDFGVSPALATATINGVSTQVVEVANKNGHAYIFKRDAINAGPIQDLTLAPGGGGTCPDCSMGTISSGVTGGSIIYQAMGMCNTAKTSNCAGTGFNTIIFAINPSDGSIVWKTPVPKQVVSTPILLKDTLIVFVGNSVEVLNRNTGKPITTITPPGSGSVLDGTGAVARGQLFFGDLNGNMFIYDN